MKTYKQHLITSQSYGEKLDLIKKPTFRSSAIFPVINNKFLETNILFLGYWLIKRKILEVTVLVTLRNQKGVIIKRETMIVDQIKSYKIAVKKMISNENNPPNFSVEFFKQQKNLKNINCFSDEGNEWRKSNIFFKDKILTIKFKDKFLFRRGRINCSLNDDGIWRWFGVQFSVKNY